MEKIKMALVGAGTIGSVHARTLYENPRIEFKAVVDTRKEAADEIARIYNVPAYYSIADCLLHEEVDAFDLCVNEEYHVDVAVEAMNAKKHVLLEKPIAKTVAGAQAIKEAAERNGVRLMVAHLLNYDARYAQLMEQVKSGGLGEVSSVYVKRCNNLSTVKRLGGRVSFMYYMAVHDIELMCGYAGGSPKKVYAVFPNKVCNQYGDDDGIFAIITFDNGVQGCLEIDWTYPETMPMPVWSTARVSATKGVGVVDAAPDGLMIVKEDSFVYQDATLSPVFNGKMHGDLVKEIDDFVVSILEGKEFEISLKSAIDAVKIIEACFECRKTGTPVLID